MSETDLHDAFPRLSLDQFDCLADLGEHVDYRNGEVLFEVGEASVPFFVVESGAIDIFELSSGEPRHVVTHGVGHFTGDIDLLTQRPVVVTAIARGDCRVFRIASENLQRLLSEIPELSDKLLEAFQLRRKLLEKSGFIGVRIVGSARTKEATRLREFFYRNHVPYTFYDTAEPEGQEQLRELGLSEEETPAIACPKAVVARPSLADVAECLGICRDVDDKLYDLLIVGAGPAGLAAAVYAASEGLSTLVVDSVGPGGQAGSSSKIENFIGFPSGITGADLANRGYLQALKFGAQFTAPVTVRALEQGDRREHVAQLCSGQTARARCVLVASGVSYRQLDIDGIRAYEGAGIYYAATSVEARVCRRSTAIVVGGGNSAGQAAMYLAQSSQRVLLVIRGDDLGKSMSSYLCTRITEHSDIEVVTNTELMSIEGDECVRGAQLKNRTTGELTQVECAAVFVFVGATPNTDWLPESVRRDRGGFLLTGSAIKNDSLWPLDRAPCDLETTVPGIMAAGDVRSGTTKRCGFAVGDGSMAITCVHRYLGELY